LGAVVVQGAVVAEAAADVGKDNHPKGSTFYLRKEVNAMPAGDGTGPVGMGPRTGRGLGYCAGYGAPGYMNPAPGRGLGLGWGRGWGRGWAGGGRGWRNMYYATGLPAWARYGYAPAWGGYGPYWTSPSTEQEADLLKSQAEALQRQLDAISQRLDELEKAE